MSDFLSKLKSSSTNFGYDVELIQERPSRLSCPFCHKIMRKPLQTYRGEIACTSCYYEQKGSKSVCPIDNELISPDQIFPDKAKEREILQLQCKCKYQNYGCNWTGKIIAFVEHLKACSYAPSECTYCSKLVTSNSLEQHYRQCEVMQGQRECPFKLVGCNYKPNNSDELEIHINTTASFHAAMLTSVYKQRCAEQEAVNLNITQELIGCKKELRECKQDNVYLREEVNKVHGHCETLQKQMALVMQKLEQAEGMKMPKSEKTQTLGATNTELEQQVEKNKKELRQVSNTVTNISSNLSDVDLRHQLHENTTYDGKMVWKIDNFKHRFEQAVTGKTTALHSAPAFTSKYGYKFCSRLYLNGDGMGKGTHISLFFVLMKSEFDNLLPWPFTKQVTFTLINQENSELNIKETFNADVNSSSFRKPVKQMNIASGCPFFVSQEKLRKPGYINDNCFFLEINVH